MLAEINLAPIHCVSEIWTYLYVLSPTCQTFRLYENACDCVHLRKHLLSLVDYACDVCCCAVRWSAVLLCRVLCCEVMSNVRESTKVYKYDVFYVDRCSRNQKYVNKVRTYFLPTFFI